MQDSAIHCNQSLEIVSATVINGEFIDQHLIGRIGEDPHVQIPTLQLELPTSDAFKSPNSQGILLGSADDQWLGSTYELKKLMKICAYADGLHRVNMANKFVAVSLSESSNSDEDGTSLSDKGMNDDLVVYFQYDRVLFQARRHWIKGTVRRRIPTSDFYCIRADNGNLFDAVPASKMELLEEEKMPFYHFTEGDQVLWVPDADEDSTLRRRQRDNYGHNELTYKAKIVRVRSSNRFDLLLRTSRVIKKVQYEQLRPQI